MKEPIFLEDLKCVCVPFWSVCTSSSLSASFSVAVERSCREVCSDVVSSPTWQQAQTNWLNYTRPWMCCARSWSLWGSTEAEAKCWPTHLRLQLLLLAPAFF